MNQPSDTFEFYRIDADGFPHRMLRILGSNDGEKWEPIADVSHGNAGSTLLEHAKLHRLPPA